VATLRIEDGNVVCARCAVASTPVSRFVGLMGRRSLEADEGLLFTRTGSIHMFFMRFALDAVFCDRDLVVVDVVRGLRPWKMASRKGAKIVIELPVGGADGITDGDRLVLSD
jgi:uncharacterized protein